MRRAPLVVVAGIAIALAGAPSAYASIPKDGGGTTCKPQVVSYGPTQGIHHDGVQGFFRTVTVKNVCNDTTWTLDIRPGSLNRAVTIPTGSTVNYALSGYSGPPYIAGFLER